MAHIRMLDPATRPVEPPAGRLQILRRDCPEAGTVVAFRNQRLTDLASVLRGRPAADAPRLARRLQPASGWAQGLACLGAIEAAAGRRPDPDTARARALLAQAESALGMITHAGLDWPRLFGWEPRLRHLRYARAALDALVARLWRGRDPLDPAARAAAAFEAEPAASALIEALETAVLPRAPVDPARLADWAARDRAPFARLIRAASRLCLAAPPPDAVPVPGLSDLAAALAADPGFGRAPHLGGVAGDPTAFARLPAVPGAARFGPVGARLLAQAGQAQAAIEALARLDPPPVATSAPCPGTGAALVEGVRGPLVHLVRLDGGDRIDLVASVAPTEWMLHPAGPLAATLAALPAERLMRDAPLVLAAHDPGTRVTLRQEATAES